MRAKEQGMGRFRIVTDSSCDLPWELAAEMNLVVLPLTLAIDGRYYRNYPDGREIVVNGTCEGKIGYEPKGDGGFGYDPVFMVGDKSFAELTAEEKDKISHRGNALKALAEALAK
jgi:hypothetical protein